VRKTDLAESALPDRAVKLEVVEVDFAVEIHWF
jgi:hypothetical protein